MMVLWYRHNHCVPKFVQQCVACNSEILSGIWYHCSTYTPDFDLCHECYKNPKTDCGQCNHNLESIQVETTQSVTSKLTAAVIEERQRSIRLHIQLLEHATECNSGTCASSNCQKMKGFLSHERQCQEKYAKEYGFHFETMPSSVRHIYVTYPNAMQYVSVFVRSRSSSKWWTTVDAIWFVYGKHQQS